MSEDDDRLRAHLRAMAVVNHDLAERIDVGDRARRAAAGEAWLAEAPGSTDLEGARLARFPDGVIWLLEGDQRRIVRSGLLVAALERVLGAREDLADDDHEWVEGPPVEVLEAPSGPPFLVIAGHRVPLRGLPLPHPVSAPATNRLGEGPTLDVATVPVTDPTPAPAAEREVPDGPLPTFLIIGAQKSATRWLRTNLDEHPEVFTAPGEPGFFNDEDRWKREGIDGYRSHFVGWSGEPNVGESTPGYMMWTQRPEVVAARIHRALPEVRLIALLRNPVDRARSAMLHHILKKRLPDDTDLLELIRRVPPEQDQLGLVSGGWYAASLAPYVELFGDRLLVLLHDDVLADPTGSFTRVISHLGATPFTPPNLGRFRESQETLLPNVDSLGPDTRRELHEYFRDDIAQLSEMLDRDLSLWDPDRDES
jgi:hypothetical protein